MTKDYCRTTAPIDQAEIIPFPPPEPVDIVQRQYYRREKLAERISFECFHEIIAIHEGARNFLIHEGNELIKNTILSNFHQEDIYLSMEVQHGKTRER